MRKMKPTPVVVDEMFPEGAGGSYMDMEESTGPSGMIVDLTSNEKAVHGDFCNNFGDLCDDDDLD